MGRIRIIGMALACACFVGCSLIDVTPTIPKFSTIDDARSWIQKNISYSGGTGWRLPEETVQAGSGDCRGYALLFAYILHNQFKENSEIVCINAPGQPANTYHWTVEWHGAWYNAQKTWWILPIGSEHEYERYSLATALSFGLRHCRAISLPNQDDEE